MPQCEKVEKAVETPQSPANRPIVEEQIPQPKKGKMRSDVIEPTTGPDLVIPQTNEESEAPERFEFEMHYGLSSGSFGGILHEILLDMSTFKHIHNWDEKLFEGPLKSILKVVHRSWGENRCTLASVIAHSTGQEIGDISSNEGNNPPPPTEDAGNVDSYLFFKKVRTCPEHRLGVECSSHFKRASGKGVSPLPTSQKTKSRDDKTGGKASSIEGTNSLSLAQGRIM
jgi:hypothetical protein